MDPESFNPDTDPYPALQVNPDTDPDPDPIRIQDFYDQILKKKIQLTKFLSFLDQKLQFAVLIPRPP